VVEELHRLRLRGSWATAFRAPSLFQVFPGSSTIVQQFDDPDSATPSFRAVRVYGNPDLKPEDAIAVSGGFEWAPLEQLSLEADLWYYDYDDIIVPENAQQIFREDPYDPRVIRDAAGNFQSVDVTFFNATNVTTDGIDFGLLLRFDLEDLGLRGSHAGTFSLGAQGTFIFEYNIPREDVADIRLEDGTEVEPPGCDGEVCDVAGNRNYTNFAFPIQRLRANFPIAWTYQGHLISLIVHFISGYQDDENPDSRGNYPDIDSYTTLDLQYSYTLEDAIGKATVFRLGVSNLLDTDPPFVDTIYGFDTLTHDPRGRLIYARVAQEF